MYSACQLAAGVQANIDYLVDAVALKQIEELFSRLLCESDGIDFHRVLAWVK